MDKTVITERITIFTIALLALSCNAFATVLPGAGAQIQQIPPVPVSQKAAPIIRTESGTPTVTTVSDRTRIRVRLLRITGQTLYSGAELLAVTGFRSNSELTLSELRVMALNIADKYHRNGYFVAHAYIPAQDIKDGVVIITVIEGRYGAITLHNGTNLSDNLAGTLLGGVKSGNVIASAPLEHSLLLLSDLPGVEVTSTLVPGKVPGASDLIVDITPGKRVTGSVDADNAGNRYTGKYRLGTTVNLNGAAGSGDVATLRVLTSGSGLYYARAAYQIQTGKAKAGIAYSILGYELGEEFKPLQANGTAQIMSIYGSYPLVRTRSTNLYLQLAFDDKTFQDRIDSIALTTDKTARVLMTSLYGNHRDTFGGGGQSGGSLTWTAGSIGIQTPSAYNFDATTAKSSGPFNKIGYSASRLQSVTKSVTLNASINGQFALKNLDVSEKMELGGMYAVRAYPEGEAYADEGYVLNLEARLELPKLSERQPGQMQLIGFIDTGTVTINRNPWTAEPNHKTLSGAGIGITWQEYDNFSMKAYYAQKIGSESATSGPDSPGQFWIQIVKYFGTSARTTAKSVEVRNDEPVLTTTEPLKAVPTSVKVPETETTVQPPVVTIEKANKISAKTKPFQKIPLRRVEKTVVTGIGSTVSGGTWSILIGTYILEEAMSYDSRQLRKSGLIAVATPGVSKKTVMSRLLLSEFSRHADAQVALRKLKRHASGAFILPREGSYAVYAGSYLLDARAASELRRLHAAGFRLSLNRAEVLIPTSILTLGPFKDEKSADAAFSTAKSSGIKVEFSKIRRSAPLKPGYGGE